MRSTEGTPKFKQYGKDGTRTHAAKDRSRTRRKQRALKARKGAAR